MLVDLARVWIRGKFERVIIGVILVLATQINIKNKIKSSFFSLPEVKTDRFVGIALKKFQSTWSWSAMTFLFFFFFLKQNLTESYSRVLASLRLENPCHRPLVVKKNINRVVKKWNGSLAERSRLEREREKKNVIAVVGWCWLQPCLWNNVLAERYPRRWFKAKAAALEWQNTVVVRLR